MNYFFIFLVLIRAEEMVLFQLVQVSDGLRKNKVLVHEISPSICMFDP